MLRKRGYYGMNSLQIYQKSTVNSVLTIAKTYIHEDEKIYVALKGAYKEYLVCTDKAVYIIKAGFMTGHTFGDGYFKMPYSSITNAEVNYHLLTGYFELSAGGLKNRQLNFWSNSKKEQPQEQPNCISIADKQTRDLFVQAANYIIEMSIRAKGGMGKTIQQEVSVADEILKFKNLLDCNIITQEEFDAKKKQLLEL